MPITNKNEWCGKFVPTQEYSEMIWPKTRSEYRTKEGNRYSTVTLRLFNKGDRVCTPSGLGTVQLDEVLRPDFECFGCRKVTVKLDTPPSYDDHGIVDYDSWAMILVDKHGKIS